MTSLLDMLKETDLQVGFTDLFTSIGQREILPRETLQKRVLLCLHGLGTNTGLKRLVNADPGTAYQDLRYARSRYIHKEQLRNAIGRIANAIFAARKAEIWGKEQPRARPTRRSLEPGTKTCSPSGIFATEGLGLWCTGTWRRNRPVFTLR